MGEIAVNQNSTIILPIPIDLFKPYLSGPDGSGDGYAQKSPRDRREEEEVEAERPYEEAVGDVHRETSSEDVPGGMPRGRENS
jgi:hypothetical protein